MLQLFICLPILPPGNYARLHIHIHSAFLMYEQGHADNDLSPFVPQNNGTRFQLTSATPKPHHPSKRHLKLTHSNSTLASLSFSLMSSLSVYVTPNPHLLFQVNTIKDNPLLFKPEYNQSFLPHPWACVCVCDGYK